MKALMIAVFVAGVLAGLCGCKDNRFLDVALGDKSSSEDRSTTTTTTTNNDSNNEVAE